ALLAGMAGTLVANAAFGFVDDLKLFAFVMFVNGVAQASGWSNNMGIMTWWTRRAERATILGFWGANYHLGGVAANGPAAAILGLEAYGYREAFLAGSAVMALAWLWCAANLRDR